MSLKNSSVIIKIPNILKVKLRNKRIKKSYEKFKKSLNLNENFSVAVSGGPDSLALAFLAKIYSIEKKLKARFYIVDHRLRSESTKEAKKVKDCLKKIFVKAEILTWNGKKNQRISNQMLELQDINYYLKNQKNLGLETF